MYYAQRGGNLPLEHCYFNGPSAQSIGMGKSTARVTAAWSRQNRS